MIIISLLEGEKLNSVVDIANTFSSIAESSEKVYALQFQRFRRCQDSAKVLAEGKSHLQRNNPDHSAPFTLIDTVAECEAAVAFDETKD